MTAEDRALLHSLLTQRRLLALGVLVDGAPYVGQLPFAVRPDFTGLLVHASSLARHSRGLGDGAPYAALIQQADAGDRDPFRLARVGLNGRARVLGREDPDHAAARKVFSAKLPTGAPMFSLGDFTLYELQIDSGRFVAGFGRTYGLSPRFLRELAAGEP